MHFVLYNRRPIADVRNNNVIIMLGRKAFGGPPPSVSTDCPANFDHIPIPVVLCATIYRANIETVALPSGVPDRFCSDYIL